MKKGFLSLILVSLLLSSCATKKDSFIDERDGKEYQTVQIGDQIWMAENLAYAPETGNYWAYDDDTANVAIYGYLYDWYTAQEVCPAGWRLPSREDWDELIEYLGENPGGKLKAASKDGDLGALWRDPNEGATNSSGFTALPAGERLPNGRYRHLGSYTYWWTSSDNIADYGVAPNVSYEYSEMGRGPIFEKETGYSVRCIKE